MYDTFLEPLHNYLLHLLTSRTPPVLQKNMRCAEYSSGDRRGPTLMGTPRHCTNHAFRVVRQWGGRGPTLMSTPPHCKKPYVSCGTAVGWVGPTLTNTPPRFKKPAFLERKIQNIVNGPYAPKPTFCKSGGVITKWI